MKNIWKIEDLRMRLGLTKMNKVVECQDNPSVRGMIKKVQHLVAIVEE